MKRNRGDVDIAVVKGPDLLSGISKDLLWQIIVDGKLTIPDIIHLTSTNIELHRLRNPVTETERTKARHAWQQLFAQKIVPYSEDEELVGRALIEQRVGMEWNRYLQYCTNPFWLMRAFSILNQLNGRAPIKVAETLNVAKYPNIWKVYYVDPLPRNGQIAQLYTTAQQSAYNMLEQDDFVPYHDLVDTSNLPLVKRHINRQSANNPFKLLRGRDGETVLVFFLYHLIERNIQITKENGDPIPIQSALINCSHCLANEALYLCGQCKTATYCSAECQEQDWNIKGHRMECKK
jgi:hypothetical protein